MLAERINKLTFDDIEKISASKVKEKSEVQKMLSIDNDDDDDTSTPKQKPPKWQEYPEPSPRVNQIQSQP